MFAIRNINKIDFDSIPIDDFWNSGVEKESSMHRIHAYPAKFPAFITTKAIDYAKKESIKIKRIADVFCGCGTVAFEAKRNDIDFWGCDINPVATLIAKVKSQKYQSGRLNKYLDDILQEFYKSKSRDFSYSTANERLKYWYAPKQYRELLRLKTSIEKSTSSRSNYRLFFLCAFSNILKPTSRWLTKSIKPQIDPSKQPLDVITSFKHQFYYMRDANEKNHFSGDSCTEILTSNFLDGSIKKPKVDMIITSPPYVTSYEYADLHQLSSLWLGYADDYRKLRFGSVGSIYHKCNFDTEIKTLNKTGSMIVHKMIRNNKSLARSITKYFLDMQQVVKNCHSMLRHNGMALFVIGNTKYRGVKIDNVRHLAESLQENGFNNLQVTKRKISKKLLTPYRDKNGRFTTDARGRKVYSEEFIIAGRK